jgi:tripartite ATP-independent transporter DctM subunit
MDLTILGIVGLIVFLAVMFLGLPVGFSMLFVGFGGLLLLLPPAAVFQTVNDTIFSNFSDYSMSVIPMFILMGEIASCSGLGDNLFQTAQVFVGHKKGGMAIAVQACCAGFGAVCGSVFGCLALMGGVAYPQMKKRGYDDRLSTSSIAAGSALAQLIPPSVPLIIYSMLTQVSVAKLFVGGIGVGIVLMFLFMIGIAIWVRINPSIAPVTPKASWEEQKAALKTGGAIEVLIVFALAMGSMFVGICTPTEGGSVGVLGMLLVTVIKKKLTPAVMKSFISNTISTTAMIYFLIVAAMVFGKFFTLSKIPLLLGDWVVSMNITPFFIIMMITVIYFVLGAFMDETPLFLLTIPIFYPIVVNAGFDGVWFGLYTVVASTMGLITPPVGMSCFILQGITKVPLEKVYGGIWIFDGALFVMIVLMIFFPQIANWLPSVVFAK